MVGDFSEDMRRMGATGSDWSDWDAHLPASPTMSNPINSMGSSLNRTLSTQTSNKFEVAEGSAHALLAVLVMTRVVPVLADFLKQWMVPS